MTPHDLQTTPTQKGMAPIRPHARPEGEQELSSKVAQEADFSLVRYSQSWEDPDCLNQALEIKPTDTILSIAAAGDNSFALLLHDPARVISIDMNPAQCALVELKRAAILTLEHAELIRFLGASQHDRGVQAGAKAHRNERINKLYPRVREQMPASAQEYWDANIDAIGEGVIHVGRLEKFFRMFRRFVLPLTHSRRAIDNLFASRPDAIDREHYYNTRFDNRRWRLLMSIFFSQKMIGKFGRDPAFFTHVNIPSVSGHYNERARHAIVHLEPARNWFLQYMMLGRYLDIEQTHPYLRESNLPILRERMHRLEIHCGEMERFLDTQPPGSIDKCNLSDIFEWMSDEHYEHVLRRILRTMSSGGRLAYWNNLVPRTRPDSMAGELREHRKLAKTIHNSDKSFLYRDFVVEEVR